LGLHTQQGLIMATIPSPIQSIENYQLADDALPTDLAEVLRVTSSGEYSPGEIVHKTSLFLPKQLLDNFNKVCVC